MHVISKSFNSINGLKRNNLQEREDRTNPITIHLKKKKSSQTKLPDTRSEAQEGEWTSTRDKSRTGEQEEKETQVALIG